MYYYYYFLRQCWQFKLAHANISSVSCFYNTWNCWLFPLCFWILLLLSIYTHTFVANGANKSNQVGKIMVLNIVCFLSFRFQINNIMTFGIVHELHSMDVHSCAEIFAIFREVNDAYNITHVPKYSWGSIHFCITQKEIESISIRIKKCSIVSHTIRRFPCWLYYGQMIKIIASTATTQTRKRIRGVNVVGIAFHFDAISPNGWHSFNLTCPKCASKLI